MYIRDYFEDLFAYTCADYATDALLIKVHEFKEDVAHLASAQMVPNYTESELVARAVAEEVKPRPHILDSIVTKYFADFAISAVYREILTLELFLSSYKYYSVIESTLEFTLAYSRDCCSFYLTGATLYQLRNHSAYIWRFVTNVDKFALAAQTIGLEWIFDVFTNSSAERQRAALYLFSFAFQTGYLEFVKRIFERLSFEFAEDFARLVFVKQLYDFEHFWALAFTEAQLMELSRLKIPAYVYERIKNRLKVLDGYTNEVTLYMYFLWDYQQKSQTTLFDKIKESLQQFFDFTFVFDLDMSKYQNAKDPFLSMHFSAWNADIVYHAGQLQVLVCKKLVAQRTVNYEHFCVCFSYFRTNFAVFFNERIVFMRYDKPVVPKGVRFTRAFLWRFCMFKYAIPYVTLLFCVYGSVANAITYDEPKICANAADYLAYKKYKQNWLANYAESQDSYPIYMQTYSKAVFLAYRNYEVYRFRLEGFGAIKNSFLEVGEEYLETFCYYGLKAIRQEESALFEIKNGLMRVYGQLPLAEEFCAFGPIVNVLFATQNEDCYSKFIIEDVVGEAAYLKAWNSKSFDKITDDTILSLLKEKSQYCVFAVACFPYCNFNTHFGFFHGLACEGNAALVASCLQLICMRSGPPAKYFPRTALSLDSYRDVYRYFGYNIDFAENSSRVISMVLDFLSGYVGSYFFPIVLAICKITDSTGTKLSQPFWGLDYAFVLNTQLLSGEDLSQLLSYAKRLIYHIPAFDRVVLDALHFCNVFTVHTADLEGFLLRYAKSGKSAKENLQSFSKRGSKAETGFDAVSTALFSWFQAIFTQSRADAIRLERFTVDFFARHSQKCLLAFARFNSHIYADLLALIALQRIGCLSSGLIRCYGIENVDSLAVLALSDYLAVNVLLELRKCGFVGIRICQVIIESHTHQYLNCKMAFLYSYFAWKVEQPAIVDLIISASRAPMRAEFAALQTAFCSAFESAENTLYYQQLQNAGIYMHLCAAFLQAIVATKSMPLYIKFFPLFLNELATMCFLAEDGQAVQLRDLLLQATMEYMLLERMVDALQTGRLRSFLQQFPVSHSKKTRHSVLFSRPKMIYPAVAIFPYFDYVEHLHRYWCAEARYENGLCEASRSQLCKTVDISYGQLSYRKINYEAAVFHQIAFDMPDIPLPIFEDYDFISLRHFVPLSARAIAAFSVRFLVKSDIEGRDGILLVTNADLVFIPHVRLTEESIPLVDCFFPSYHADNISLRLDTHFNAYNIVFNADCKLNLLRSLRYSLDQRLVLPFGQILNVLQQTEAHRLCYVEAVLKNGYSYTFVFYDTFNYTIDIPGGITAEIACGVFYWVCGELFGCNKGAIYCTPDVLRACSTLSRDSVQFCALGPRCVINPDTISAGKRREQLKAAFAGPTSQYISQYRKLVKDYLHGLHFTEVGKVPRFEPLVRQTSILNYVMCFETRYILELAGEMQYLLAGPRLYRALAVLACRLLGARIISIAECVYLLNRLSGLSNNDCRKYPIVPMCKGRIFSLPPQMQTAQRFQQNMEKLVQVRTLNTLSIDSPAACFSLQIPLQGTYPSNSAVTLYYNFRQQGWASALVRLQGGHFDTPDRMFRSYDNIYAARFTSNSREHTEDLLQLYTYFNTFEFDLGACADGKYLSDVYFGGLETPYNPDNALQANAVEQSSTYQAANLGPDNELWLNYLNESSKTQFSDENVQNAYACIDDLHTHLAKLSSQQLMQWAYFYFGSAQCDESRFSCYGAPVYVLRVTDVDSVRRELQQAKYFGTMPDRLLSGEFEAVTGTARLLDLECLKCVPGILRFKPQLYVSELLKNGTASPAFERISDFDTRLLSFEHYKIECFGQTVRIFAINSAKTSLSANIFVDSWILGASKSFSYFLLHTESCLTLLEAVRPVPRILRRWDVKCKCSCISSAQIVYCAVECDDFAVFALDGLNGNLVAANTLTKRPISIMCDGGGMVYIITDCRSVLVFTPDLVFLGEHTEDRSFHAVPLRGRLQLLLYRENTVTIIYFGAINKPVTPKLVRPNQAHKLACWGHSEVVDAAELVYSSVSARITGFECISAIFQRDFTFSADIIDVRADAYSVAVKTATGELYSIISDV